MGNEGIVTFAPITTIPFEEAYRLVVSNSQCRPTEEIAIGESVGRVMTNGAHSRVDLPPFDNSAVDGFALHLDDLPTTSGRAYRLVGESRAGSPEGLALGKGQCVRAFTGAPLPAGTGGIVMQEDVILDDGVVLVRVDVEPGDQIRRRAAELALGQAIVEPGLITPATVAALASGGVCTVSVPTQPRVAVIVTGDELADSGSALEAGKIYESNSFGLVAALQALGIRQVSAIRVRDEAGALKAALAEALKTSDVVITSGGVSVGAHDLVRPALDSLGVQTVFWGVSMKPGKPMYFGKRGETAVFGLPGNPVSALVCFSLYVRTFLRIALGLSAETERMRAKTTRDVTKRKGRTEFVPCRVEPLGADPDVERASHKSSSLAAANGLMILPAEAEHFVGGAEVEVIPLKWGLL